MDEEEEEVYKEQELKLALLDRKKTSSKGYFMFYGFSFLIKKINDVKQGFILNFVVSFNNFFKVPSCSFFHTRSHSFPQRGHD